MCEQSKVVLNKIYNKWREEFIEDNDLCVNENDCEKVFLEMIMINF